MCYYEVRERTNIRVMKAHTVHMSEGCETDFYDPFYQEIWKHLHTPRWEIKYLQPQYAITKRSRNINFELHQACKSATH